MKYLLIFTFAWMVLGEATGQTSGVRATKPPKVVIGFLVENMRSDYVSRYWNKFGDEGFRKLWSGGTVCTDFRLEHHIQNYATGTATLFTGVHPSVHGIIDRTWYDREKGKVLLCTEDEKYPVTGASSKGGNASPRQLLASTLGDRLKLFTNGKSKVYSAGTTDVTALYAAGLAGDAAFWFDSISGNIISGTFYMESLPDWVKRFNDTGLPKKYAARNWAVLKSLSEYTESTPDACQGEKGYGPGRNTFPHQIGNLVKAAGNYSPLKSTPFINTLIREFAISLLENEPIGTDEYTDLVTFSFSSMDDENGSFGPASVEMEDLYLRLDLEIAELISAAEKKYGKENVAFFLTANTSASYPASWLKEKLRFPTGEFSSESVVALLNSYLNITYGDLRWISYNNGLQLYLDKQLIELNKVDLREIRSKVAEFVGRFEGVEAVATADQMEQGEPADPALRNVFKTYKSGRSGDVMYILREGWQPVNKFKKINYTDQSLVPLVFYGSGIPSRIIKTPCDATWFAPTLAEIMRIPRPEKSRGQVIEGF